jgi:hypothetical protein
MSHHGREYEQPTERDVERAYQNGFVRGLARGEAKMDLLVGRLREAAKYDHGTLAMIRRCVEELDA